MEGSFIPYTEMQADQYDLSVDMDGNSIDTDTYLVGDQVALIPLSDSFNEILTRANYHGVSSQLDMQDARFRISINDRTDSVAGVYTNYWLTEEGIYNSSDNIFTDDEFVGSFSSLYNELMEAGEISSWSELSNIDFTIEEGFHEITATDYLTVEAGDDLGQIYWDYVSNSDNWDGDEATSSSMVKMNEFVSMAQSQLDLDGADNVMGTDDDQTLHAGDIINIDGFSFEN